MHRQLLHDWRVWTILALAMAFRLWGIAYGLPHIYHQDEPIIVNHALALGVNGLNPEFFIIPPFIIYLLFASFAFFYLICHLIGLAASPHAFGLSFISDPTQLYLIGRVCIGVVFGVATVYLSIFIGSRYFSKRIGVLAGLFLSICFVHVQMSHYIYADVPLSFACMLILALTFYALEKDSLFTYISLGCALGWATSVKYTALYLAPSLLIIFLLLHRKELLSLRTVQKVLSAALASAVTFALFVPFVILDFSNLVNQLHKQSGAEVFVGWFHHMNYSIKEGMGLFFMIYAAIGLIVSWKKYSTKVFVLITICVFYYLVNVFFSQHFARYMLPVIPMLILLAAIGADWSCSQNKKVGIAALVLALSFSTLPALRSNMLFARLDSRDIAREWIWNNIPVNSRIALDNKFFTPRLEQNMDQLKHKYILLKQLGDYSEARKKRLDMQIEIAGQAPAYEIHFISEHLESGNDPFLFNNPQISPSLKTLKDQRIDYLIVNSFSPNKHIQRMLQDYPDQLIRIQSFSSFRNGSHSQLVDLNSTTAAPHLNKDLWSLERLGPCIQIYKINYV